MWILDLGWHHLVREVMEETSVLEGTASSLVCISQSSIWVQEKSFKTADLIPIMSLFKALPQPHASPLHQVQTLS